MISGEQDDGVIYFSHMEQHDGTEVWRIGRHTRYRVCRPVGLSKKGAFLTTLMLRCIHEPTDSIRVGAARHHVIGEEELVSPHSAAELSEGIACVDRRVMLLEHLRSCGSLPKNVA